MSANDDLADYVTKMRAKLDSVLRQLEWDLETLRKQPVTSVCRNDRNHHVPSSSISCHEQMCSLVKQGLSRKEAQTIYETRYHPQSNTDVLNMELSETDKMNILAERGQVDPHASVSEMIGSRAGRLAVYEYVVEKAKAAQKLQKFKEAELLLLEDQNEDDKASRKSDLESLVAQRDNKRRRQSYRAKNVHITKKTYTEVMREVISNQMEMLEKLARHDVPCEPPAQSGDPHGHDVPCEPPAQSGDQHGHEKTVDSQRKRSSTDRRSPKYERKRSKNDAVDPGSRESSRSNDRSEARKHGCRRRSRSHERRTSPAGSRHKSKKRKRSREREEKDRDRSFCNTDGN